MTPEGKVKAEYRKWLRSIGAYVFSPTPMGFGHGGVDDFVCYRGRFLAIEAKRPDKKAKPTKLQETCLKAVILAGGLTVVAQSLDDVKRAVRVLDDAHNWGPVLPRE